MPHYIKVGRLYQKGNKTTLVYKGVAKRKEKARPYDLAF